MSLTSQPENLITMLNPSTDYIPTAADLTEFEGDEVRIKAFSQPRKKKTQVYHGGSRHPLYLTWNNMIDRCTNPRCKAWPDYGGRTDGPPITVCERWADRKTGFAAFLEDIGPRPEGYSLDRIDFNGPYSPENCRWADRKTQNQNKRNTRWITCPVTYRTLCLLDWAKEVGIHEETLRDRLEAGWEITDALYTPSDTGNERRKRLLDCPDGVARGLGEAARHYGLPRNTLQTRLKAGWSVEAALTTPQVDPQERARRAGEAARATYAARRQAKEAQATSCPSSCEA